MSQEKNYQITDIVTKAALCEGLTTFELAAISAISIAIAPFAPNFIAPTLLKAPAFFGFSQLSLEYIASQAFISTSIGSVSFYARDNLLEKSTSNYQKLLAYATGGALKYGTKAMMLDNQDLFTKSVIGAANNAAYGLSSLSNTTDFDVAVPVVVESLESGPAGSLIGALIVLNLDIIYPNVISYAHDLVDYFYGAVQLDAAKSEL